MTATVDALPSSAEKNHVNGLHPGGDQGSDEGDGRIEVHCPALLLPTLMQLAIRIDGEIKRKRPHLLTPDISHCTQ